MFTRVLPYFLSHESRNLLFVLSLSVLVVLSSACAPLRDDENQAAADAQAMQIAVEQTVAARDADATATAQAESVFATAVAMEVAKALAPLLVADSAEVVAEVEISAGPSEPEITPRPEHLSKPASAAGSDQERAEALLAGLLASGGGGELGDDFSLCNVTLCARVIATSNVNVREGPGTNYPYITSFQPDTTVAVIAESPAPDVWVNVWLSANLNAAGWIKKEFVRIEDPDWEPGAPIPSVPIVSTIPPAPREWPTVTPTPTATPSFTPTPTALPPTATPDTTIVVIVENRSDVSICELVMSPQRAPNREDKLERDEVLSPDEVKLVYLSGRYEVYDLYAWACGDDAFEDEPFDEQNGVILQNKSVWEINGPLLFPESSHGTDVHQR